MNASDQVRSVELAQAVASVAVLFRQHFPDARANLTPWRDDPQTRPHAEQESLDTVRAGGAVAPPPQWPANDAGTFG